MKKEMKTWAEMTERERDVLVCQTLGYIPCRNNWWMNPNEDFNCDPKEAFEWVREGDGVEYKGSDARFKNKKFLKPVVTSYFSTDRAAAMTLLDGAEAYLLQKSYGRQYFGCIISFGAGEHRSSSRTETHAICLAFLRAKGVEIE